MKPGTAAALLALLVTLPAGAQPVDAAEALANARAALTAMEERYTELETANHEQARKLLELEKLNKDQAASLARLGQARAAEHAAARKLSAGLVKRAYRGLSRRVAGAPGMAVPYVGAGVITAMTALDIREGCEQLRELNEMNRVMQLDPEQEAPVCAMQIGSREEIINQVLANWRTAYAVAAAWTNQYEIWLTPEPTPVTPARANELWRAVFGAPVTAAAQALPLPPRPPTPPFAPLAPTQPGGR